MMETIYLSNGEKYYKFFENVGNTHFKFVSVNSKSIKIDIISRTKINGFYSSENQFNENLDLVLKQLNLLNERYR